MKFGLSTIEERSRDNFVSAVEALMLDHDAASVGRIADNIGEYGAGGSGGMAEDEVIRECLRIIVDAKARQK